MSFGSILLGALIGGIISAGGIIGTTFLGTLVPWWALLLIGAGGVLIGGFVGGLIARGGGAGALAGLLSGVFVALGIFLFSWLYYKAQLIALVSSAPDVATLVNDFLTQLGMAGTDIGLAIETWITTNAPTIGEITAFANSKFWIFALILGGIFGVLTSVVGLFSGLIGGLFTKKKEEEYDSSYY